jgi:hypothetical protein
MATVGNPPRVLLICGSLNQTTQMHAIARAMPGVAASFTPFYASRYVTVLRRAGLLETTIGGEKLRGRCLRYLTDASLNVDLDGARGGYDLVVACTDVVLPENLPGVPVVVVQEGVLDPDGLGWQIVRRFPRRVPHWLAGTAATGLSGKYQRFCVASPGYRDLFVSRGAPAERIVVTGIPNFDDCQSFQANDFPRRDYVLVCTSDARETFKLHDRRRFILRALGIANGRPIIFKLHPNERVDRARREIAALAPQASIYVDGPTGAMIANCSELITHWSSVAFIGLALGKSVHSSHPIEQLKRLMPEQNRSAAARIGRVCQQLLGQEAAQQEPGSWVAA